MTSHTSTKTHFGMDERGLGGTHMIQQQFLTMHRKVRDAQKLVDNNPPTTSMFRRPYFSQFGEYWERIKPPTLQCKAKVDSSAPKSYKLIANLYINKKEKKKRQSSASPRSRPDISVPEVTGTRVIDVPRCNSLDEYAEFCDKRRQEIAEEMTRIKRQRVMKTHQSAGIAKEDETGVAEAAKAALLCLDTDHTENVKLRSPAKESLAADAVGPKLAPSPPPRDRPTQNFDMSPVVATPRRFEAVSAMTPTKMSTVPHPPAASPIAPTPPRKRVVGQMSSYEDDEDQWDDH